MRYRVNWGNGQVGNDVEDFRTAKRSLTSAPGNGCAFVEFYDVGTADDPGDWFTVPGWRERER